MGISSEMKRAVFLDRDGVLNDAIVIARRPYPPASVAEVVVRHDTVIALRQLKAAGFLLIGVTNQPDVARGATPQSVVTAINRHVLDCLPLTEILVCYHDDEDRCACRKPQPGLLLQAAERYQIDLQRSYMIGDRWRDVEAGNRAGCHSIFLDYQYDEKSAVAPSFTTPSLLTAVEWIISKETL